MSMNIILFIKYMSCCMMRITKKVKKGKYIYKKYFNIILNKKLYFLIKINTKDNFG
jgi:hypothetical protein